MSELKVVPIQEEAPKKSASKIREKVSRLMERHGLSQADLADQVGISRSVISSWLGDKYPHDGDVIPAIEAWIVRLQGGEEESEFIETKNARRVFEACTFAVAKKKMVAVIGPPGLGKTVALKEFYRRAYVAGQETIYYHVSPLVRPGSLARMIARRFTLNENRTAHDLIEEVVSRLKRKPATLLFDEANALGVQCLEEIRYLHDMVRVPIILCGSRQLLRTLMETSERFTELEQLQSRIAMKVILTPLDQKEVGQFLLAHFEEVPAEVAAEAHRQSRGVVRNLANGVENMRRIAKVNKVNRLTVEIVRKAFEQQVLA